MIAKDTLGVGSAIRVWDGNNIISSQVIATGAFPSDLFDFENVFPFPSLNNNGQTVFLTTPKEQFPNIALSTLKGTNFWGKRTYNEKILATGNVRPMIADNGTIVARAPLSSIALFDYQLNAVASIASDTSGFTSVGLAPGISDDGKVVTFYGDLTEASATALGLTPGEGIFASIDTGSGIRKITRIAGLSGNGHLAPGETHEDTNNNGKVDLGEDKGLFSGFAKDERVGISYRSLDDKNLGTVVYLAFNNGQESLLSSQFEVSASGSQITHLQSNIVAKVGLDANLVSPALTGKINDLNIYDPVNNLGKVAFWLKTSTSQEAIVRANPVLKPILIVPGIGGSLPKSGGFKDWLLNRGASPDTMEIDPLTHSYNDLIETLKRAGYTEGVNLFVATYDWRLNPGPIDGSINGKINRTVEQLTDDTYEYAVDQLAFWLKEAIKGWRSQFPGVPESEILALDSVDIITHSTGGLVARSYIQSDAYEQSFSFEGDDGNLIKTNLPKVNNFFMIGVPNRGASLAWNPLNNNFLGGTGSRLLKHITRLALKKVNKGETILLSGKGNLNGVIAPPLQGTELDPVAFIEQYVPTVRSLLATYPFFRRLQDSTDTLKTIESVYPNNPNQKNTLLLDLNNGFDSGGGDPNLFAEKVNQISVIYGTNEKTRDAVWEREPHLLPSVLKLNDSLPSHPQGNWYEDKEGRTASSQSPQMQGDRTVLLLSAEGTFLAYPKGNIELEPFTKPKAITPMTR